MLRPITYQQSEGKRTEIPSNYKLLAHNQVALSVGSYNHAQPLIVDPVLSYSTYLGGSVNDQSSGIAVDASGSAYVVGFTSSPDFPATSGAFQSASQAGNGQSAFVTKFNPAGTQLVYSTFLGGTAD